MASDKWYNDSNLVSSFGTALIDASVLEDTEAFKSYLNKPFKFNAEYEAWEEAGYPTTEDDNWDEFVEAISTDEEESDEEEEEESDEE